MNGNRLSVDTLLCPSLCHYVHTSKNILLPGLHNCLWFTAKPSLRISARHFISTCHHQQWIREKACIFRSRLWDSSKSIYHSVCIQVHTSIEVAVSITGMSVELNVRWETRMYITEAQTHMGGLCVDLFGTWLAVWVPVGHSWPAGATGRRNETYRLLLLPLFFLVWLSVSWTNRLLCVH